MQRADAIILAGRLRENSPCVYQEEVARSPVIPTPAIFIAYSSRRTCTMRSREVLASSFFGSLFRERDRLTTRRKFEIFGE